MPATTTPLEISYDLSELIAFLKKDPNPIVSFYGGEPLLRIKKMEAIIDAITAKIVIQTNGTFLTKIKPKYLEKIDAILLSIDGQEEITDYYRGKGIYQRIRTNMEYLENNNYGGELIARMTISEQTNIFKEVNFLLNKFNAIHWQLNMFWDPEGCWKNKKYWIDHNYNPGITKLLDMWIDVMQKREVVLKIVPFIAIMYDLLRNKTTSLRCGSGKDAFAIATSGDILACPISPEYEFMHIGNIKDDSASTIRDSLHIDGYCLSCDIYDICGGRCLFVNKMQQWHPKEFNLICSTVKHLIKELQTRVPLIKKIIDNSEITLNDFHYPMYNNGCEIIP